MMKSLKVLVVAGVLSIASTMTSFAGWEQQVDGVWKYSENGAYLSGWQWIDGNNDNVAECYYLDADGIMAVNTTIEGYTVDINGAWTVDNIVQTKAVNRSHSSNNVSQPTNPTNESNKVGNTDSWSAEINFDELDQGGGGLGGWSDEELALWEEALNKVR